MSDDSIVDYVAAGRVIIYDPPECVGQLTEDVADNMIPIDVAMWEVCRAAAAQELRNAADALELSNHPQAAHMLRNRADAIDPEGSRHAR